MDERRAVVGYEGLYEVTSSGDVWRVAPTKGAVLHRPLKGGTAGGRYRQVGLVKDGECKITKVARIVCEAFNGPAPSAHHQCNHINGCTFDNRAENLEWLTPSQNTRHRFDVLKKKNLSGEDHPFSKLTAAQVSEITRLALDGYPQRQIAAHYGVSRGAVVMVVRGTNWPNIEAAPIAPNIGPKRRRPRGLAHHNGKLSELDKAAIRASNAKGRDLAKQYGVGESHISYVRLHP